MISIIVPVYKVEKYLAPCIESILAQTFREFELILVDDGSPDNCGCICDEYAKRDSRIRVIHKDNGGLSDARNAGLDIAKGEYVAFIDSDDVVHPDYLSVLYEKLIINGADISVCKLLMFKDLDPLNFESSYIDEDIVLDNYKAMENIFLGLNDWPWVSAHCKLYKRDLFKQIRFPKGKLHEDTFTTYRVYYEAKKIVASNRKIYYYRNREDSIMNQAFNIKSLDIVDAGHEAIDFVREHCFFLLEQAKHQLALLSMMAINRMALSKYWDAAIMQKLRHYVFIDHPFWTNRYTIKQKIWLFILLVNSHIYCMLYRYRAKRNDR